jgi:enoyl-CoA hydratase/carnithine racemase
VTASLELDGAIARLTLERPESLNALHRAMADGMEGCLGRLEESTGVAAVIVAGRGRSFRAGAEIRAGRPGGETRSFAALRADEAARERIAGLLERRHTRTS